MYRFFMTLLGLHGKKAMRSAIDATAALDVETASAAQLIVMEQDLDKAGKLFAQLKVDAGREEQEAIAAEKLFNMNIAAAEELQRRADAATTPEERTRIEASLNVLVARLEELQEAAKTERSEADEANALLVEAETAYREKADALLGAKKKLDKGAKELTRAKISAERAEARAETAAQVAGLRSDSSNDLNGALSALDRQIASAKERAASASMKAVAFQKPLAEADQDALVQDALKAVSGSGSNPSLPARERLALLSGKTTPTLALAAPTAQTTETKDHA